MRREIKTPRIISPGVYLFQSHVILKGNTKNGELHTSEKNIKISKENSVRVYIHRSSIKSFNLIYVN